jgi:hypothetical protein
MHKCFFIIALLCIVYSSNAQNIILGRPGDTFITASILFEVKNEYFIEYGIQPGKYIGNTPVYTAIAGKPDEIDLTGLSANTRYYYRLQFRSIGQQSWQNTPEYTFHTQRAPGSSFTFTIEADEHLYDKKGSRTMYQMTLANQAKDKPDFMLSLGDTFGDDHEPFTISSAELDKLHKDYRPYLGNICHSIPFYFCLGNHEGEMDYYLGINPPDNLAIWGTLWRKVYYPNPFPNSFYTGNTDNEPYGVGNPENYYAWTWGDALFVVLDVYRDQCDTSAKPKNWDWSLGYKQYTWLRNTLEQSKQKYKFVFAHHVRGQGRGAADEARLFEWGGYEMNGRVYGFDKNRPGWGKPIHKLFVDNGVTIFFQGHDHLFAREILDGIIYQECPMAADSTYIIGMTDNADAYHADTLPGTGHLRVQVSDQGVKVDFVRAWMPADTIAHQNGETVFSYTVGQATGIDDKPEKQSLYAWPNPADKKLILPMYQGQAILTDLLGNTAVITTQETMDIAALAQGIYFLRFQVNEQQYTQKIHIIH